MHGVHPYLLWGLTAGALTVALAAASYYLVERPALSLRSLVGGRGRIHPEAIRVAP